MSSSTAEWLRSLNLKPRYPLAQLPTPVHRLWALEQHCEGTELWIKRDDLTGLAGGGNKTRKLEFLVGDALRTNADTLVTVGAMQSNHTRQTAAAAARAGMKCALLHCGWTRDQGLDYGRVGNLLLSSILGAQLFVDYTPSPIEGATPLDALAVHLSARGSRPYVIPGGGSDHRLGSLGYALCAAEIVEQSAALGIHFDYVVHTTGSGSTQSGLLAGFAALHQNTRVIGIADDDETSIKRARVLRLANATLTELGSPEAIAPNGVDIVVGDASPYGVADEHTLGAIRLMARTEGLITDPVYEGKAIRGLLELVKLKRFGKRCRVLLMHLGGTPAVHAYASAFEPLALTQFPK